MAIQTENFKNMGNDNPAKKAKSFSRMQQALIAAQELGDEKMSLLQNILDKIEIKTRLLDQDFRNLGISIFINYCKLNTRKYIIF